MGKLPDVIISEVLVKKAAVLACGGADSKAIASQLGITQHQAREILKRDDFSKTLEEVADEVIKPAKARLKAEMAKMTQEVIRVLYANLEENNLEAVKLVMKAYGFGEEEAKATDTTINVILPGSEQPAIEVNQDDTIQNG